MAIFFSFKITVYTLLRFSGTNTACCINTASSITLNHRTVLIQFHHNSLILCFSISRRERETENEHPFQLPWLIRPGDATPCNLSISPWESCMLWEILGYTFVEVYGWLENLPLSPSLSLALTPSLSFGCYKGLNAWPWTQTTPPRLFHILCAPKKIRERKRHGNFLTKRKASESETCVQARPKRGFQSFATR